MNMGFLPDVLKRIHSQSEALFHFAFNEESKWFGSPFNKTELNWKSDENIKQT